MGHSGRIIWTTLRSATDHAVTTRLIALVCPAMRTCNSSLLLVIHSAVQQPQGGIGSGSQHLVATKLAKTVPNFKDNKNLAIANRSRVSCAHNTLRASVGINITLCKGVRCPPIFSLSNLIAGIIGRPICCMLALR